MKVNGFFFQISKIYFKKIFFCALFTLCTHYARIYARDFAIFYKNKSCRGRNTGTTSVFTRPFSPMSRFLFQLTQNTSKIRKKLLKTIPKASQKRLKNIKKATPQRALLFCV